MEGKFSAPTNDTYLEEQTLVSRIQQDTIRLNEIYMQRLFATGSTSNSNQLEDMAIRKQFVRAQDKILWDMLSTMESCKAQGFVYGLISKEGKVVTGSSENLRSWWQGKARFHQAGPIAIANYYSSFFAANSSTDKQEVNVREKLLEISDTTLGTLISALMQHCEPPQKQHPIEKGIPPCWWPTTNETWWTELEFPSNIGELPYKKPHGLLKIWKTAVLIAIIKNISPDTDRIRAIVNKHKGLQDKMSAKELQAWSSVLDQVDREYWKDNPNAPLRRFNDNASSYLVHNFNSNVNNVNRLLNNGAHTAPANNALIDEGYHTTPPNNNAAQIVTEDQISMDRRLSFGQDVTDFSSLNMNAMKNSRVLPSLQVILQQPNNGFCNQGGIMGNVDGKGHAFHQAGLSSDMMQQNLPDFQFQGNMNDGENHHLETINGGNDTYICNSDFYEPSAPTNNMQFADPFPAFDSLEDFLRLESSNN